MTCSDFPRFGPAGNDAGFHDEKLKMPGDIVPYLRRFGLTAYEYQCGRGVRVKEENAAVLKAAAAAADVALSLHGPYYISLSGVQEETRLHSLDYILQSAKAADLMGADRVIVHTGSAGKITRERALELAADTLKRALELLEEEHLSHISLCPETMGKVNQLGTLEEVVALCRMDERLIPCVDFGHLYARSMGRDQGAEFFAYAQKLMEDRLGAERGRCFHVHFSHIRFTDPGGEKSHTVFEDPEWGPDFAPLGRLIARKHLAPRIICESAGTQARDAQTMMEAVRMEQEKER